MYRQNLFKTFLLTTTLTLASFTQAGTLGLETSDPMLTSSDAVIDYLEFDPDGDLSTFGAFIDDATGTSPAGFAELSFGIAFDLADPEGGAKSGGFAIDDEDGVFLQGSLARIGFLGNVIELYFNGLSGSGASDFGSSVLTEISFFDSLGPNPFDSLVDGEFYGASITVSNVVAAAAVPAPAPSALLLLITGLCGVGLRARQGDSIA